MHVSPLVLIIEDEFALRKIYEHVLSAAGYEIMQAEDGAAALDLLSEIAPALIVLDILLPKVDGMRILEYIRTVPHLRHTRVIIVTAHDRFRYQSTHTRMQEQFLLKPIRPQELLKAAQQTIPA